MKVTIPDPGGAGVVGVLAAADQVCARGYMLGSRDAAVIEAADEAIDHDDWAADTWWLTQPAGGSL